MIVGDAALAVAGALRFALDRLVAAGVHAGAAAGARARGGDVRHGLLPVREERLSTRSPEDGLYLVGTSEVPLIAMHLGEILETSCRCATARTRRASAARREPPGSDTRGMFRVHQFQKVEMVAYCDPEGVVGRARAAARDRGGVRPGARVAVSRGEHRGRRPRRAGREEVRHRGVVPVAAALPRDDVASNTTDFQARRSGSASARDKGLEPVHTLNGTATTDRGLLAILENFGGDVPDVLRAVRRARARHCA